MRHLTPFLMLVFLALACQDQGPTEPLDPSDLTALAAKPNCDLDQTHPACKDDDGGDGYSFVYPMTMAEASAPGSDCWYPEPGGDPGWGTLNPFGRDFRCPVDLTDDGGNPRDPVLRFQVMSGGDPVSLGTVRVWRCENVETHEPVPWELCGVRQRPPYHKLFASQVYHIDMDLSDGVADFTFTDRVVLYDQDRYPNQPEELGWGGFRWKYLDGDNGSLESDSYNIRPYPQGSVE